MNETTRRTSLRGMLAIGVGAAAAMVSPAQASMMMAQEKIAQEAVQYQKTPKDGAQCNKCVNWVDPNACKIVAGTIEPQGWCVAFAPKEG